AVAMGQIVPVGQDQSGAPPPSAALDGAAPASAMDAVLAAGDPSAAIAAYSRAVAQGAGGVDLLNAFVVRMVELGAPEAAHVQARELISAVPNHGLAWAVVAAASALDGDMTLALSEVAAAVRFAPDEPFVQHMAGEMVAWYDAEGRESSL